MTDGLKTIRLRNIRITDPLFGSYRKLVAEKVIPYQWEVLNDRVKDAEPTYCIENFKIAAGDMKGTRKGVNFRDSDLYKWLEAVAYCIEDGCGARFEPIADEVIELIGRAQEPDGYLNTYFTLVAPQKRWSNLVEGHELYCAGHMIEAAVAYFTATGKRTFLDIAMKNADLICKVFGRGEGQIHGYPGHQEIEVGLVKLYRVTKERRYLDLASYFIGQRGKEPNYFRDEIEKRGGFEYFPEFDKYDLAYSQAHIPPVEQRSAEGHAVRAMYMYSAMADLALECDDGELLKACRAIWDSMTKRRMYVTGSIGSSGFLERFTTDYDLPNTTNYSETCASVGIMMFGQRMAALTKEASYYDTVERALYNTVLGGLGITGDRYFYVNPLEVVPEFCTEHTYMEHIKPERQRWYNVACCPPNIARTLASLGQYIYARDHEAVYINQFISSTVELAYGEEKAFIEMDSTLLRNGRVKLAIRASEQAPITIKLRVPEYAGHIRVMRDGQEAELQVKSGYVCFYEVKGSKTLIEIDFDVKPGWVSAHDSVRADAGKVALMKGPLVYCLEEKDNGRNLASVYVYANTEFHEAGPVEGLIGELPVIEYDGVRISNEGVHENELYASPSYRETPVRLKAIPYCLWNNRGKGEMLVWQKVLFKK